MRSENAGAIIRFLAVWHESLDCLIAQLRLCAHFVRGGPLIDFYEDNIQSTERTVRIRIGEEAEDIEFPS